MRRTRQVCRGLVIAVTLAVGPSGFPARAEPAADAVRQSLGLPAEAAGAGALAEARARLGRQP